MMPTVRIVAVASSRTKAETPAAGPCLLNLSASFTSAVRAVAETLCARPGHWIVATGPAVDPFLRAVWGDLSLSVAGAVLIHPKPWPGQRPLAPVPLPFPAALVSGSNRGDLALARAWGAELLSASPDHNLFDNPALMRLIRRRESAILRGAVAWRADAGGQVALSSD
jgi:hypothetical protein